MEDDEKGLPLSFRDKIVLGKALQDDGGNPGASDLPSEGEFDNVPFEADPESFSFEADPESFTFPPTEEPKISKRPRLDDSLTLHQELPASSHLRDLPTPSMEEPTCKDLPLPDESQPVQQHAVNIQTDSSWLSSVSTPSHADVNLDSPYVPVDDDVDNDSFGPDYFLGYCSEEEAPVVVPMDLPDMSEMDFGEDYTSEDVINTGATERKEIPLYKEATISQQESLAAILSFVSSEHLSCAGLMRLLSLINLHLPKPNTLIKNSSSLWKVLEELDEPVFFHYFCSLCYKTRKDATDICETCKDESKCVQYFIHLPLVPQLKKMFARPGFQKNIGYKESRIKKNIDNIEDVYDSLNYKEAEKKFKENCTNITFTFNTDGMQIFNSNTFSLWPFYLVINELAPNKRFLSENLLIAGLWGSVVKPHPNLFLLPIYKDLKLLKEGIDVKCYGGDTCKVVATVISGTCDAPACACFMNMKGHSGFYSCPVCLIRGEKPNPKLATVFPYDENIVLRNIPQYEEHKKWAVEKRVIVLSNPKNEEKWCGIKGPSILSEILPNMFDSMSIDAMHCVYLGNMRALLHLWTDKEYKSKPFSLYSKLKIINAKLCQVSSPHFQQRSSQTLDKLVHWKASELRSFLFNLCLPLLKDFLEPDYYVHLAYFVSGISLLNSTSISEGDRKLASLYLEQFVSQFSTLYGAEHMTHNLHKLLHLERSVRLNGPLYLTSCFPFEDMNGRLSNFIHGTRYVDLQIHTNLSIVTQLPLMVQNLKEGEVKEYCTSIIKKRKNVKVREKIPLRMYLVGGYIRDVCNNLSWIKDVLARKKLISQSSVVQVFSRLLKDKMLFVASSYARGKRDSSYVKYLSNNDFMYGNVECFVKVSCSCLEDCSCQVQYFAIIRPKPVSAFKIQDIKIPHIFTHQCCNDCNDTNNSDVVNVSALSCVLYKINSSNQELFFCEPLNSFELE